MSFNFSSSSSSSSEIDSLIRNYNNIGYSGSVRSNSNDQYLMLAMMSNQGSYGSSGSSNNSTQGYKVTQWTLPPGF